MEKLFLDELREIYGAERHQIPVLHLLKKAASSLRMQNMLANHLDTTHDHIGRLEEIFKMLGRDPEGHQSEAVLEIVRAAETVIESTEKGSVDRDAGLVVVAQKLERYEVSSYASLARWCRTLEYDDILDILEMTLHEEKEAADLLTVLAENYIRPVL